MTRTRALAAILMAFAMTIAVPVIAQEPLEDAAQEFDQEVAEPVEAELEAGADAVDDEFEQQGIGDREALPQTASPLAVLLLIGAGSLGSAAAVRFGRRR